MNRRDFLRNMLYGSAAAAVSLAARPVKLLAGELGEEQDYPDIVAVRNGEPAALIDRGIEAMGGMKSFVRKGQTVLIKPNIAWSVEPDRAANTNPAMLKRVIEHCLEAGAQKVTVFDHTCDNWQGAYKNSALEQTAKDAGAVVAPGHIEGNYQDVSVPGSVLKRAKVHELYLSSDVIINFPVLKHHGGAGMTAAMKNLMGVVWDRGAYHSAGLDGCIADFCLFKRPTLNIIDAYKVMLTGGPRGTARSQYSMPKMVILSANVVAADSAAAMTFGANPSNFDYIAYAEKNGLGSSDLSKMNIQRITL